LSAGFGGGEDGKQQAQVPAGIIHGDYCTFVFVVCFCYNARPGENFCQSMSSNGRSPE
jgi:hypothetical protein